MLTKRPLLDTASDRRLFVFDASRQRAETLAFQLSNTLIVGEPGSGKTSLLYAIRGNANDRLPEIPRALLIDARLAEDPAALVDQIVGDAAEHGWIEPLPDAAAADDPFGSAAQIRRLRAAPENSMILLDDTSAASAANLFGRLRDELWQTPVWFTVAVTPTVEAEALRRPPADAFFDNRVELLPFASPEAREMLDLRASHPAGTRIEAPERPLQPRAVLLHADASATGTRYDSELLNRLLNLAEATAGRSGAMVIGEIWNRGAASASDASLQASLGLSRARLTQILTSLEREGALVSFRATETGRQGRPRMLYDVARGA